MESLFIEGYITIGNNDHICLTDFGESQKKKSSTDTEAVTAIYKSHGVDVFVSYRQLIRKPRIPEVYSGEALMHSVDTMDHTLCRLTCHSLGS